MNSTNSIAICEDCVRTTSGHCGQHPMVSLAGWPNHSAVPALWGAPQTKATFVTPEHLCPDLLRHEQIGAADGWRGRVVRGFFWLLRAWPVSR